MILPASSVTSRASGSLRARAIPRRASRTSSPRRGAGTVRHCKERLQRRGSHARIRIADRHAADLLPVDRRNADELAGARDPELAQQAARLPRRGSCQQLLRSGHGRDPGVDRLVPLGEAQADQVARRVLLGERRQRHDRDPCLLDRRRRESSRRRGRARTRRGRRTGSRSRPRPAPRNRPFARPSAMRSRARAKRPRIGSIQASPSSRPNATAACKFGAVEKVRNWWARAATLASSGAATIHPTFHPVSEKILPAEPILIVRSAIPGSEASGVKRWPSSRICSHTSSAITIRSWSRATAAMASSSSASNRRPAGLCGLLNRIARVFGPIAAVELARVDPPQRRAKRDLADNSARAPDHRRIAVVSGCEHDHLVPRADRREDRRAQRFGRAEVTHTSSAVTSAW